MQASLVTLWDDEAPLTKTHHAGKNTAGMCTVYSGFDYKCTCARRLYCSKGSHPAHGAAPSRALFRRGGGQPGEHPTVPTTSPPCSLGSADPTGGARGGSQFMYLAMEPCVGGVNMSELCAGSGDGGSGVGVTAWDTLTRQRLFQVGER